MLQQVHIVVALPVADLAAEPGRTRKFVCWRLQFEFCDHQAGIVAQKLVDFEHRAGKRDMMADFLDPDRAKLREHALGVRERDRVFVLAPFDAGKRRLDGQPGAVATDTNAHGTGRSWAVGRRPLPTLRCPGAVSYTHLRAHETPEHP